MYRQKLPPSLLLDVSRFGFQRAINDCPENFALPAALRTAFEYLGEPYGCQMVGDPAQPWCLSRGYTFLMGISGIAFDFILDERRFDAQRIQGALRKVEYASGYPCQVRLPGQQPGSGGLREMICDSLQKNRPVLAFGLADLPGASLVTGYEEYGTVLLGCNPSQDSQAHPLRFEKGSNGLFRAAGWEDGLRMVVLIGERAEKPCEEEIYHSALDWCGAIMRLGCAEYTGLMRQINEGLLPIPDAVLGRIAEARWYAVQFLSGTAQALPALAGEIVAAMDCFEKEHDLMWRARGARNHHPAGGGNLVEIMGEAARAYQRAACFLQLACPGIRSA